MCSGKQQFWNIDRNIAFAITSKKKVLNVYLLSSMQRGNNRYRKVKSDAGQTTINVWSNSNPTTSRKVCFCYNDRSRIKGWWRLHHFISTVVSGVFLIWPNNTPWYLFRQKFMIFNVYISEYFYDPFYVSFKMRIVRFILRNIVKSYYLEFRPYR